MVQLVLIGIGAGAASALLFASVASGVLISILLFYLAPLPILIAALGWSHWAALIAALTASAGLAAVFGTTFFIAFLAGIGLPAWWLGYLALLARPVPTVSAPDALEWYPVGHLIVWTAIVSAAVVGAAILNFGINEEGFQATLRDGLERMLRMQGQLPASNAASGQLVDLLVVALPPAAAVIDTLTNIVNLWLATRIVLVSGRLRRPMPDLSAMRFPVYAPALFGLAIAGTFIPGLAGVLATVLAFAVLIAYGVLGLAVLHAITRGLAVRPFVLGSAYAAVMLGWPILALSMLGLADSGLDIRGRIARKRGLPTSRT